MMQALISYTRSFTILLALVFGTSFQLSAIANTEEAILLNRFHNWYVYKGPKGVVFMTSKANRQTGTYSKREDPYLMISDFGDARHEVSVYTGYTHKSGSTVSGTVNLSNSDPQKVKHFVMYTHGERAWLKGAQDQDIVEAFKRGAKVVLSGESHKGTTSTDTYLLNGFSDAYRAMANARKS